jgi:hypothetical protein
MNDALHLSRSTVPNPDRADSLGLSRRIRGGFRPANIE